MIFKRSKIKRKIEVISTRVCSILIPVFQYVPCLSVWKGIMSVPLITYLIYFFQYPKILLNDYHFLFQHHGIYYIIFGFWLFVISLIYQLTHRNQLIRTGPYKYLRHPQYLAFIFITLLPLELSLMVLSNGSRTINRAINIANNSANNMQIWRNKTGLNRALNRYITEANVT